MSHLKSLCIVVLLLVFGKSTAQDQLFFDPDVPPKCAMIKEGTFVSNIYPSSEWTMTVHKEIQTELYDNGKKFVKIIQHFNDANPCQYELVVLEDADPDNGISPGDHFVNTIIATQGDLIQLKSESKDKGVILVLKKIK